MDSGPGQSKLLVHRELLEVIDKQEEMQEKMEEERGSSRIRTGDSGFAIRCLTTWRRSQL